MKKYDLKTKRDDILRQRIRPVKTRFWSLPYFVTEDDDKNQTGHVRNSDQESGGHDDTKEKGHIFAHPFCSWIAHKPRITSMIGVE